jgi:hypothetical protein
VPPKATPALKAAPAANAEEKSEENQRIQILIPAENQRFSYS